MNNWRHIQSVVWKDIQVLSKERGALAVLFLLPLLVGSMMASMNLSMAASARGERGAILLDVGLVNRDAGTFGQEISKALQGINVLRMESFATATTAEERVAKGQAAAAIVIPPDFSQKIDAYMPTSIEVIVDPAQPESTSIVTGIMNQVVSEVTIWGEVQYGIRNVLSESGVLANASPQQQLAVEAQSLGVIMTRLNELRRSPAIAVQSQDLEGIPVSSQFGAYFAYLFPGLAVMFVFFGVSLVASGVLLERETGTLRRLMAAPLSTSSIIAGKMVAHILVACAQVAVLLGVARVAFGMPLGRSPLGLVVVTLATALTSATLGLMLAALCKTSKQADNLATLLGFVLGGLGGAISVTPTPLFRSAGFMGTLSKLTPQAHAVDAFIRLMAENAPVTQVLPNVGVLLLMSAVFFMVAARRLRLD